MVDQRHLKEKIRATRKKLIRDGIYIVKRGRARTTIGAPNIVMLTSYSAWYTYYMLSGVNSAVGQFEVEVHQRHNADSQLSELPSPVFLLLKG